MNDAGGQDVPLEQKPAKSWKRASIRILGSAFFLGVLLYLVPLDVLLETLRRIPVWLWGGAILCYLLLHWIGIAKWRMLMRVSGASLGFFQVLRCYYFGLFGNTFLPSVVGGDVFRTVLAVRMAGSTSAVVAGSVVDRFVDIVGLAAVAGLGILFLPRVLDEQSRTIFLTLVAILAGVVLLAILAIRLLPKSRIPQGIRARLQGMKKSVSALARNPVAIIFALVYAVILQTLLVVLNAVLANRLGVDVPFTVWLFVWPIAKISALLPVTQGGIGVREAAQVALLTPFGVPMVSAVAVGLSFQAIVLGGGLVAGAISYIFAERSSDNWWSRRLLFSDSYSKQ